MMGTGSCALQDAIRLTQASIEAGVFSVLVIPPFYYKPHSMEDYFLGHISSQTFIVVLKVSTLIQEWSMLTGVLEDQKPLMS